MADAHFRKRQTAAEQAMCTSDAAQGSGGVATASSAGKLITPRDTVNISRS